MTLTYERRPYGLEADGKAVCVNAEPGTYGHECGKPAHWIGRTRTGFQTCFCDRHKKCGYEARDIVAWRSID